MPEQAKLRSWHAVNASKLPRCVFRGVSREYSVQNQTLKPSKRGDPSVRCDGSLTGQCQEQHQEHCIRQPLEHVHLLGRYESDDDGDARNRRELQACSVVFVGRVSVAELALGVAFATATAEKKTATDGQPPWRTRRCRAERGVLACKNLTLSCYGRHSAVVSAVLES